MYRGSIPLLIFIIFLAVTGLFELQRIYKRMNCQVPRLLMYGSALLFPLIAYLAPYGDEGSYLFTGTVLFLLLHLMLLVFAYPRFGTGELAASFLGSFYISVLLSYLILIRKIIPSGFEYLLLVFLLTWACDIGAYFVGSIWGRHPLCPAISPNKTLEGSAGGLLFSLGVAALFQLLGPKLFSFPMMLLLGGLTGCVVQLGDLVESALKRMGDIKDSGDLIPGHGGILDRFDSILFSAPVAYFFIKLLL